MNTRILKRHIQKLASKKPKARSKAAKTLEQIGFYYQPVINALEDAMHEETDSEVRDQLSHTILTLDPLRYWIKDSALTKDKKQESINELLTLQFCYQILETRIAKENFDMWYWQSQQKVVLFCIDKIKKELSDIDCENAELTKQTKDYILQAHPLLQKKSSLNSLGHKEWLQKARDRIAIFIKAQKNCASQWKRLNKRNTN